MDMVIPNQALPYILFQRTGYVATSRMPLVRKIPYRARVAAESIARRRRIKELYARDMEREYRSIAPFLPKMPGAILDIGCGIAGIDAFLFRHYAAAGHSPDIYLLDKEEETPNIYYGFNPQGASYNSLALARTLLEQNAVPAERIHTVDAGAEELPRRPFGLIISLISWGYHYPVDIYAQYVTQSLVPSGMLILDIRANTGGREKITALFPNAKVVEEDAKRVRLACLR